MANHGPAYGLSADIKAKLESKLDPGLQRQAIDYIYTKTGIQVNDFHQDLKDGTQENIFFNNFFLFLPALYFSPPTPFLFNSFFMVLILFRGFNSFLFKVLLFAS